MVHEIIPMPLFVAIGENMKPYCLLFIIALLFGLSSCVPKSKLDEAQTKLADTETKLAKAEARIAEFEQKISQGRQIFDDHVTKNSSLQKELDETQQQLAEANAKLTQKPPLPVTVSFAPPPAQRQPFWRKETSNQATGCYVLKFETTIKRDFPVVVQVKSRATGIIQELPPLTLAGTKPTETYLQVFDGDEITIKHADYQDKMVVCPHSQ